MDVRILKQGGIAAEIRKNNAMVSTINAMQLKIVNSGYALLDSRWKADSLAVPFNRLYLVESGIGYLSAGEQALLMEPGKAYLLPAGLPCSYRCEETVYKLFFDFNLFKSNHFDLLQGFSQIAVVDLPSGLLDSLRTHYFGGSFADSIHIQHSLYHLLHIFHEQYGFASEVPTAYSPHVASTIDYIQENLSARLRVDTLASRCYISRTNLAAQFRKEVGIPIGSYIDQQLIRLAQYQLTQTDASIEAISNALGYCNPFYFSKCFKKHCGLSPLQYRKSMVYG